MLHSYRLGERVKITGTCTKEWRDEPIENPYLKLGEKLDLSAALSSYAPSIWVRYRHFTDYTEAPLPMNNSSFERGSVPYEEGVIVGRRTVSPGETVTDYDSKKYMATPGESKGVWLVAFDLRRKPVMCFDHQVSPVEGGDTTCIHAAK